jgi:gliding motility-associated-like protein
MKKNLFLLAYIVFVNPAFSQFSTLGTEFWVSFKQNFDSPTNCILYMTSDVSTAGTVSMPGTGWSQNFTIAPNGSSTIQIPDAQGPCITTSNTVLNRGIRVVSNNPIAVYAANQRSSSSDATLVLPTVALGDEYLITTYSGPPSQFVIVGSANNTTIQVIPKAAVIGGVGANVPFNVTLNAGEVYLVQSNGDLTGSSIKATNLNNCENFAVFAGNKCSNVPMNCNYCDHLYEQMIPLKAWGNNYATAPLMTRNGDQFRILAKENSTTISINGAPGISLNAGQFHEVYLINASFITADKPISVAQYSRGTSCDGVTSDPFMIMLSPVEQMINNIVFQAFNTTTINQFYTNIITKTVNTSLATLDGLPIPGWATITSNPSYSFARRNITQGSHILHSDSGLIATVYGFGNVESYGYLAGAKVQPLDINFSLIVGPDTIAFDAMTDTLGCDQQTVTFMTDPAAAIYDISWNFGDGTTAVNSPVTHTYIPGTYTATLYYKRIGSCVVDSLQMFLVFNSQLPNLNFPADTLFCNPNASMILDASSTGATSYLWNTGSTNPTLTITSPGIYSVTATDPNNCTVTDSITVSYINLILTTTQTNVTCMGMSNGSVGVTVSGGDLPYTYNWNTVPPSNLQNVTDLPAGTYTVTVTESNGCSATASATIVSSNTLYMLAGKTDVTCYGDEDGTAWVTADGGTPPLIYEWNTIPPQSTSSLSGLSPGVYSVTVTDSNGCTGDTTLLIESPAELLADISNNTLVSCNGSPGQITVTVSGGTLPYSYIWNTIPVQTGITATNLSGGTYSVTVTDNNGCSTETSATYTSIGASVTQSPEYCDQKNGTASVIVNQFTESYFIEWNNGSVSENLTGISTGTYTVTVTDETGSCSYSLFVPEIQGPVASISLTPNPATIGEDMVFFTGSAQGATNWFWDFGDNSFSTLQNPMHTYNVLGTFTVWLVVTDDNNCIDTARTEIVIRDVFTIYVPNAFSPNGDGINEVFMPLGMSGDTDQFRMTIYNRWGRVVFQTTSINQPWDGKVSGTDSSIRKPDVYSYIIEYRDQEGVDRIKAGVVTLIF